MLQLGEKGTDRLLGGLVIGLAGAAAGFFMAEDLAPKVLFTLGGAGVGAALGMVTAALGGRRFLLFIAVGASLGALLAIYVSGAEEVILGAATGGTIGGFSGVMVGAIRK